MGSRGALYKQDRLHSLSSDLKDALIYVKSLINIGHVAQILVYSFLNSEKIFQELSFHTKPQKSFN